MDGKTHAVVGLATGIGISYLAGLDTAESIAVTSVAIVGSLAPDLDTAGRLTHRITKPFRFVNGLVFSFLLIVILGTLLLTEISSEMFLGGIGALIALFFLKKITIRYQLLIMAIVIGVVGHHYEYSSILLFGLFIGVASFLPHRSYTHSLIGLAVFSYISHQASIDFDISKLYHAGSLGYLSHLLLDSRLIPGNRTGIRILLPLRRPIV